MTYPSYRKYFGLRLRDSSGSGRMAQWNILNEKLARAVRAQVANDMDDPPDPATAAPKPDPALSRWIYKSVPA